MSLYRKFLKLLSSAAAAALITASAAVPKYADTRAYAAGERISAADFGANGNDRSDDTKALNKALACAKNDGSSDICEVYVPAGTYYVDAKLIIYSNTRLILDKNAVIKGTAGNIMLLQWEEDESLSNAGKYAQFHDIYISGGTWDAGGLGTGDKNVSKSVMFFNNGKNVTIKDTTICNCYGNHFVNIEGVDGITVTNVKFKDFVPYKGSKSTYDFTKDISDPEDQKSAIGAAEALHTDFAGDNTPCGNIKVSGCSFSNVPSGIGTHHIKKTYVKNVDIYNNKFEDIWYYCVRISSFRSTKIHDNTAVRAGSLFRSQDSEAEFYNNTMTGLTSTPSSRYDVNGTIYSTLIQDNSEINYHDNVIRSSCGIGAAYIDNGSKNNIFTRNIIDSPKVDGMFIEKTKLSLKYNTIRKCGRTGVKAMTSQVSCEHNNIVSCSYRTFDLFKGCTSSVIKNNGITSSTENFISKDSSVDMSDNMPSISEMSATIPSDTYSCTGSEIRPAVTVKNGSSALSADSYSVSYKSNVDPGTAEIMIEGKGKYRGFILKKFTITDRSSKPSGNGTGIKGDANGDKIFNIRDAAYIARSLAKSTASKFTVEADYNGDGTVNVRDAAAIAKYLAKKG